MRQSTPRRVMCRTCLECVPLSELRSTTKAANCESPARNMKQKSSGTRGKRLGAGVPLDRPRPPPVEYFMRLLKIMQVHRHCCAVVCSLKERFLCPFASVAHCQKSAQQYKFAAPWSVAFSRSKPRTRRRQGGDQRQRTSRSALHSLPSCGAPNTGPDSGKFAVVLSVMPQLKRAAAVGSFQPSPAAVSLQCKR
jgi:hypothetical protein